MLWAWMSIDSMRQVLQCNCGMQDNSIFPLLMGSKHSYQQAPLVVIRL